MPGLHSRPCTLPETTRSHSLASSFQGHLSECTLGSREQRRRACRAVAQAQDPLLLRVARGEDSERVPVWLMRQAGRYMPEFRRYSDQYGFRHRSETADIAIELSLQPWRAFQPDGVIMFSDILTILPALGVEFDVVPKKGPIIQQPLRSMEQIKELRPLEDPGQSLPFIHTILQALRQEVGSASTVVGFVGSPWTLAAYAVEGKSDKHCMKTKTMMFHNPKMLHALLGHLTDALVRYVCHQIDCGAQVVQVFDSWAHHLSPAQFTEFSLHYAEEVLRRVRAERPGIPLIFHANGGAGKLQRIADLCSADVIGVDWHSTMSDARQAFGRQRVLQGNVDPMVLFGPQEQIASAVHDCLTEGQGSGGRLHHILNVGHGVAQGTPPENVAYFCELARQHTLHSNNDALEAQHLHLQQAVR